MTKQPKWTVCYNIVSGEDSTWVGTGWEFFDEDLHARQAYDRHIASGNTPTKRPFHGGTDWPHLGAAHRYEKSRAELAVAKGYSGV